METELEEDHTWADGYKTVDPYLKLLQQNAIPDDLICLDSDFFPSICDTEKNPIQTPGCKNWNETAIKFFIR